MERGNPSSPNRRGMLSSVHREGGVGVGVMVRHGARWGERGAARHGAKWEQSAPTLRAGQVGQAGEFEMEGVSP